MTEERQNERDSQLSAMFDGELPAAECELLARRLTRDEALRAQWSRFSTIGAALRSEQASPCTTASLASPVADCAGSHLRDGTQSTAAAIATIKTAASASWARFARPVAGASIAAGVAAISILWLRTDVGPDAGTDPMLASNPVSETIVLAPEATGTTVALNQAPAGRACSFQW